MQAEYDRFVLEFAIPVAVILLVWREDPRRYGMRLGDWPLGCRSPSPASSPWPQSSGSSVASPTSGPTTTLSTARPLWRLVLDTGVDLFAWEFFFRGWMLWAFGRKYGTAAIWLQIIPFALMHVYKPEIEALDASRRRHLRPRGLANGIVPLGLAAPLVHGGLGRDGGGRVLCSGAVSAAVA